ncbi:MAG: hypothetical protein NT049_05120, partial [Planctomycetota bacterium]|nr:hypothetical protein [Planctomycetota bacterium]
MRFSADKSRGVSGRRFRAALRCSALLPWAALAAMAAGLAAGPAAAGVLFTNPGPAAQATAVASPEAPDKPDGDLPADTVTIKCPPKACKLGMEAFCLPKDYRNADGTFNQESITAQQKSRMDVINDKLGTKLRLAETPHYLVFSDTDAAMTAQFVKWSEQLFASLGAQFGIEPKERIWDGKCLLIVFRSRPKFQDFARVFDENSAVNAGAFFAWEHYEEKMPECVHICIPLDERDPRRLQELFAHEGTHAFFQLFHRPVELPLWLHEGLAEYMTVVNDPLLRSPKMAPAAAAARKGAPILPLL